MLLYRSANFQCLARIGWTPGPFIKRKFIEHQLETPHKSERGANGRAGSLYVEGVFPEGDRGANSIPTKQSKNMHALWDGLLGRDFNEGDAQRRIAEINALKLPPVQIADCKIWLDESRMAARESVYAAEVLEPISVAMRSGSTKLDELQLSESYLKNAGRVAQVRAWEASDRLAHVLK